MIFKPVSRLEDKGDKSIFLELAGVYIRLVEVFCEKHRLEMKGRKISGGTAGQETSDGADLTGGTAGPRTSGGTDLTGEQAGRKQSGESLVRELCSIGVITGEAQLPLLKDVLGGQYGPFLQAVETAMAYEKEMEGLLDKLYNSRRKKLQEKSSRETSLSLVDFFCGAGGLSLGFIQEGFHVKLANDIEDVCIRTYRYNHPELPASQVIQGDIKEIVDRAGAYIHQDIDVVVGGPPCQGFSEANRQRVIDDPRNKLYKYFVRAVEQIAPRFVVMENVKGMLKVADQVVEDYSRLRAGKNGENYSYLVDYRILNSQHFSVAQSRERLIYIAVRSDVAREKNLTPDRLLDEIEAGAQDNPTYVLMDALEDIRSLEAPRIKNQNEIDSETCGKKIDVNPFENHQNPYLDLINQGRKIPYVFNHKARYVSDVNYEIYRRLDQGDDATNEKIRDIMPYAHRNHCFKDKYYKLIGDRPCRTITAHLKMDCHSHIHPYQVRSLTPREAARVQSFPDDYLFLGAYLKTYMEIGNAVPPVMARAIARVIRRYL